MSESLVSIYILIPKERPLSRAIMNFPIHRFVLQLKFSYFCAKIINEWEHIIKGYVMKQVYDYLKNEGLI